MILTAMRGPVPHFAATGVRSVKTAVTIDPSPRNHFPPNFSARYPPVKFSVKSFMQLIFENRPKYNFRTFSGFTEFACTTVGVGSNRLNRAVFLKPGVATHLCVAKIIQCVATIFQLQLSHWFWLDFGCDKWILIEITESVILWLMFFKLTQINHVPFNYQ